MAHAGRSATLENGQAYHLAEKRHGMPDRPARRPSKKAKRKWRRLLRRRHMAPDECARLMAATASWRRSRVLQGKP